MQKQPARFTGRRENESSGSVLPKAQRGRRQAVLTVLGFLLPAKESLAFYGRRAGAASIRVKKAVMPKETQHGASGR
ncbi:hypothetical protein P9302_03270 [Brevibacillus agri]|uniref:hypothetical protein n=1 Tax=Brevibacillus agri TaxID=51101 RepID=UPI00046FB340|nr:hypothetical protein [Brevibacillus agri]MED4568501.1 hypothetical protein [Brevibacillus agri]WHX30116.1 hypothetical protein QNK09_24175 [Brevibacillus agri]